MCGDGLFCFYNKNRGTSHRTETRQGKGKKKIGVERD